MLLLFFLIDIGVSWGWIPLVIFILPFLFIDCNLGLFILSFFRPKKSFQNKVVWITGASSGIGEEFAYEMARMGATLVLSARRQSELERVRNNCQDSEKHIVVPLDLDNFSSHKDIVSHVFDKVQRVDLFVNNAARGQQSLAVDTLFSVDELLIRTNTLGSISMTKAILPYLINQRQQKGEGKPHIMVVSSLGGKVAAPMCTGYSASKHALHGFFSSLSLEVQEIEVSIVCPGPVVSPMNDTALAYNGQPIKDANVTPMEVPGKMMKTERCAYLMSAAAYWRLKEVWITKNPYLLSVYLSEYSPMLFGWILSFAGPQVVKKWKAAQLREKK